MSVSWRLIVICKQIKIMPKEKSIHEIKQTKCLVVDPVNFLLLNQVHISNSYNTTTMFKYFKFILGK